MLRLRLAMRLVSLAIVLWGAGAVFAQDYPSKPVRLVAPAAGGGGDLIARILAQGMAGPLGQQVIVENRAGLAQIELVSKSPPDGYTLLVGGATTWIAPLVRKTLYQVSDFTAISMVERSSSVLVVHPSLPVKSVKELIALAKARPGELNYGSSGPAGSGHLAGELFKALAGVNIVHVAYPGSVAANTAVISGEVQLTFVSAASAVPYIKSGRLRALAITSTEPSALAPGLPPIASAGVPGYEAVSITGLLAPVKTPMTIINRLNQEVVRYVNQPDVKQKFFNAGIELVTSTPEEFGAKVQSEIARLSKVIKEAGIKAE